MKSARKRAKAIAQGRGRDARLVIPLAFEIAARISARPLDAFRNDPTQLSNALSELNNAINADGIVCAAAGEMELQSAGDAALNADHIATNGPVAASLEACRRLRQSAGDEVVLLAGVTGPATLARQFPDDTSAVAELFGTLVKRFCEAGADIIFVIDDTEAGNGAWADDLKTAGNIARFHQASLLLWNGTDAPYKVPLDAPAPSGVGIITTSDLVPGDADIAALKNWVTVVKGT
jgi:hypothetical protein